MRNIVVDSREIVVWSLFFATSVYGHVALKLGCGNGVSYDVKRALHVFTTFWGASAVLAWMLSSFFWTLLLTKNSVITANTISAFRYVLICLAAMLWLREAVQWKDVFGIFLVSSGVWVLAR